MIGKLKLDGLDLSQVEPLVQLAIREDIGTGDVTSASVVPREALARGRFILNESGIIAGLPVVPVIFRNIDVEVEFVPLLQEGSWLERGTAVAEIVGAAASILTGERLALNFLQRLSGIATLTSRFVAAVNHTPARILDTRKTTPGWRCLEKYAVRIGGGMNHRIGLFDRVLIKDNHLKLSSHQPITDAVRRGRANCPAGTLIEVEAECLEQVREALDARADIIMLDNMTVEGITEAVKMIRSTPAAPVIEASGRVTLGNVRAIAETGVDWISVGELTHSAKALDIRLDLEPV